MEVSMCKHCGKMFSSKFRQYACVDCKAKDDELFDRVMTYLQKYPNSNATQIAEGLEINVFKVVSFINEGRLEPVKGAFERTDT